MLVVESFGLRASIGESGKKQEMFLKSLISYSWKSQHLPFFPAALNIYKCLSAVRRELEYSEENIFSRGRPCLHVALRVISCDMRTFSSWVPISNGFI